MACPVALTSLPTPSTVLQAVSANTIPIRATNAASLLAIVSPFLSESTDVDKMPGDRGRRRHRRADQVGAAARTLAALEVAVGGRRTPLAGTQPVVVHAQAHRASRLPPFESRRREDAIQPFALGLRLDRPRSRHDQRELDRVGL